MAMALVPSGQRCSVGPSRRQSLEHPLLIGGCTGEPSSGSEASVGALSCSDPHIWSDCFLDRLVLPLSTGVR